MAPTLALTALLVPFATAHTIFNQVAANGQTYAQGYGIYMPSSNYPITDVNSNSIACNGPPTTGFRSSSNVISVTAGSTLTGAWLHELTSTGADGEADNKVIASSHKGPVTAWLKKVNNAASDNPSAAPGSGWFKIAEEGLISSNQWAVDKLISNGGIQTVQLPSCLADGDYLLRLEIIALHNAYSQGGAQFYQECAQLRITGGTNVKTPSTVSLPGVYGTNDPGIVLNIYNAQGSPYPSSYQIPGPRPFSCSASKRSEEWEA